MIPRGASFALSTEPGTGHQSEDSCEMAEAGDGRGYEDRPHRTAVHCADGGRGSRDRCVPASYTTAIGRLPLCPSALNPASNAVSATSVFATAWHLASAGYRGGQAQAAEVQALPHPLPGRRFAKQICREGASSTSTSQRCRRPRASSTCSSASTGRPSSPLFNSLQKLTERQPGSSCSTCSRPCPTGSTRF